MEAEASAVALFALEAALAVERPVVVQAARLEAVGAAWGACTSRRCR